MVDQPVLALLQPQTSPQGKIGNDINQLQLAGMADPQTGMFAQVYQQLLIARDAARHANLDAAIFTAPPSLAATLLPPDPDAAAVAAELLAPVALGDAELDVMAAEEPRATPSLVPPGLVIDATPPIPSRGSVAPESSATLARSAVVPASTPLPVVPADPVQPQTPAPVVAPAAIDFTALARAGDELPQRVDTPTAATTITSATSEVAVTRADSRPPLSQPTPVSHPRFSENLNSQVLMLARGGLHEAKINLNPPELGPLEVRISMRHDEALVQLAAHNPGVRDTLEQALPRLRELFSDAGIRLGESAVFDQLPQREGRADHQLAELKAQAWQLDIDEVPLDQLEQTLSPHLQVRLIDAYV